MREQLLQRLKNLKTEFESGQKQLANLETQANNVRNTLLRISGAIQVLEEELAKSNSENGKPAQQQELQPAEAAIPSER
jgi:chromosome segregation ATPase